MIALPASLAALLETVHSAASREGGAIEDGVLGPLVEPGISPPGRWGWDVAEADFRLGLRRHPA